MAGNGKGRAIVILAAGWVCLASAALNVWNMIGAGVTPWRIFLAGSTTLVGVLLLVHGYRERRADDRRSES